MKFYKLSLNTIWCSHVKGSAELQLVSVTYNGMCCYLQHDFKENCKSKTNFLIYCRKRHIYSNITFIFADNGAFLRNSSSKTAVAPAEFSVTVGGYFV